MTNGRYCCDCGKRLGNGKNIRCSVCAANKKFYDCGKSTNQFKNILDTSNPVVGEIRIKEYPSSSRVFKMKFTYLPCVTCGVLRWTRVIKNESYLHCRSCHVTDDVAAKISKSRLARKENLGYLNSLDTREKIRKANTGHVVKDDTKVKISKFFIGKKLSPERVRKSLRRRILNSLETKFYDIVIKNNLPYRFVGDGSLIIESFNPDFVNEKDKILIEVYAKYFKTRDGRTVENWKNAREKVFSAHGWKTFYFETKEVEENNVLNKLRC